MGNTLAVWFGKPQDEYEVEETGDKVILMKDKTGRVIGFKKLNFINDNSDMNQVNFETIIAN